MPNLQWRGSLATTVNTKAAALGDRFYPEVDADLANITDTSFIGKEGLSFKRTVTEDEIRTALKKTKPDKCPGADEILNRFLKAIEDPLVQALTAFTNQCWEAEYFPKRFQTACTIVLQKSNKLNYSDLETWCSIAFLSTIEKIIKTVIV
jgi:hypothetical protein